MSAKRIGAAVAVALALSVVTMAPAAEAATPRLSFAITGGTLGVGPEIGIRSKYLGARADATFLSFGHKVHSSGVDYQGNARLRSAGSMFDYYPYGGGFRLSAGGRYNLNRLRIVAIPNQPTVVGGQSFTPAQIGTLSGIGSVRKAAPAFTLGYGGRTKRGFTFGIDGGALVQGKVHIHELTSSTGLVPQTRLEVERANLQDDIAHYRLYPIVQASLGWRF